MKISTLSTKNKRENNQDSFFVIPKLLSRNDKCLAALVADGMGGTEKGDVASLITKEAFDRWFENEASPIIKKEGLAALKSSITKCAKDINSSVIRWGEENGESLGSTAAFLILRDGEYIACNIGDSRIYRFGTRSVQITKDHTLAALEVEKGNLTEEEAMTDKRSHRLTMCIGIDENLEPDFFRGKYKDGDYFLLCSDGMYNTLTIKEIESVVKGEGGTKEKLSALCKLVQDKGETDNVTGILIEI